MGYRIWGFVFLFSVLLHAGFEDEWIIKHGISAGVDFAITKGDLDGISHIKSGDGLEPEIVILPEVPFFLVYAAELRVHANAASMALNFGLGFPKYEHDLQNGDARYLRFGLEYQYHFFWPEPFRIGAGLGYGFSRMQFSNAVFTGNGPNAVVSAQYYFTENFAAEGAIRYRLLHFNKVSTDLNTSASKLSEAVWQGMGELGLRGLFVF